MPQKPLKLSNFVGKLTDGEKYIGDLDKDVKNIVEYLKLFPRFFQQSAEPTLNTNEFAFWKDTDDSKFYLLVNIGTDQKKVELT